MSQLDSEQKQHLLCVECFVHAKMNKGGVMVIGPPKCGKSTFSIYFALEAMKAGRPVIFVAADEPPEDVQGELAKILDVDKLDRLATFVDCYSWRTGFQSPSTTRTDFVSPSPKKLSELSITLDKLFKQAGTQKVCCIVDSLSSIVLDAGTEPTRMFVQTLLARMKAYNSLLLTTVGEGLHEKEYELILRSMFDGIVELKLKEEENSDQMTRLIRVYAMRYVTSPTKWYTYQIRPKGLNIPEMSLTEHLRRHMEISKID